ncbi:MAG: hypothetical protein WAV54_09220 [Acidimicrobiales bacterium]
MIVSREVAEQPVAALEAGEPASVTVTITRNQLFALPRGPTVAGSSV